MTNQILNQNDICQKDNINRVITLLVIPFNWRPLYYQVDHSLFLLFIKHKTQSPIYYSTIILPTFQLTIRWRSPWSLDHSLEEQQQKEEESLPFRSWLWFFISPLQLQETSHSWSSALARKISLSLWQYFYDFYQSWKVSNMKLLS